MRKENDKFGMYAGDDVPDLDGYTAINLAMNRAEWKENRPSRCC